MPRTEIAVQTPLGSIGDYSVADAADIIFGPLDQVNLNDSKMNGKILLLVTTEFGGNVDIDSVNDPFGRKRDILNYDLGSAEFAMFGPFDREGWMQTNEKLNFDGSQANMTIAVIRLS